METIFYLATDGDIEGIVERVVSRLQPRSGESEKLYSVAEVMAMLGVTKPTLLKLRKTGILPAIKIGGSIRFRGSDIKNVIEKKSGL